MEGSLILQRFFGNFHVITHLKRYNFIKLLQTVC